MFRQEHIFWQRWSLFFLILIACYEIFDSARWSQRTIVPDKSRQVIAARSLLLGEGLTIRESDADDVSKSYQRPLLGWPPGYSLLVAPLLLVCDDIFSPPLVIDIVATVVFLTAAWFVFSVIPHTVGFFAQAVMFAWWFFVGSPLKWMWGSDRLSLALFCAGVAVSVLIFRHPRRQMMSGVVAAILVGAAASVRNAYWPLVVTIPLALVVLGYRYERRLIRVGVVHAVMVGGILGAVWIYQTTAAGSPFVLSADSPDLAPGLYLEQLKGLVPFPAGMLGLPAPYKNASAHLPALAPLAIAGKVLLWLISVTSLWICGWETWRCLKPRRTSGKPANSSLESEHLFLVTGLALLITVSMLLYLTVRYPALWVDGREWFFGQEWRYYAPTSLFLYLGLTSALTRLVSTGAPKKRIGFLVAVLVAAAAIPAINNIARLWFTIDPSHVNSYEVRYRNHLEFVAREFQSLSQLGRPVVYIDPDLKRRYLGGMVGATMVDPASLGRSAFKHHSRVSILAALPGATQDVKVRSVRRQLEKLGAETIHTINGVDFLRLAQPVRVGYR